MLENLDEKRRNREKSAANLAASFGVVGKKFGALSNSRATTLNITRFKGNALNGGHGMPLESLCFNDAAKLIRADGVVATDREIDKMLSRQNGVKLSNGVILKDVWSKGSHIPTTYDD